jgi:hypothetical protein
MRFSLACGMAIAVFVATLLKPAAGRPDGEAGVEVTRQKRLEFLQSRVDQFEISLADNSRKLTRGKQTILRWSNPVREFVNDGVIYLFLDGQRPRAVISVWARSPEANLESGEIWREFVSLSGSALTCQREGGVLWTPLTRSDVNLAIEGAPSPAAKPVQRLAQMRELARRFQATSYKMGSPNELRLLSQPLYRYQDEAAGIVDGTLFAFVEANDPEALLLLETAEGAGKEQKWRYTLARMTGYRVEVRLDERSVFDVPPYWKGPRSPDDLYVEARDGTFTLPK